MYPIRSRKVRNGATGRGPLACTGAVLLAMALTPPALAQDEEDEAKKPEREEVLVTGTYIRGVRPTGAQVIGITEEDVQISGAVNANDLLATVPQVTNLFNERTTVPNGQPQQIQVVRPNLRNLPGGNLATGAATLVLLDGHRLPSVGVGQAAPDSDMIPPGVVQRVELATDGGSAIYGSDAIGGVINFMSRKRIDGVELDLAYGLGDDYNTTDLNLTAGHEWDTGSVYASYSFGDRDELLGKDRSFARRLTYPERLGSERRCAPANVSAGGVNYAMPDLQPNTFVACDPTQQSSLSPEQERQNFFAGYSQDIGDRLELGISGFYSERDVTATNGPILGLSNIGPSNPYYMDVDGGGGVQNVSFDFSPYNGNGGENTTDFTAWSIAPTLNFEFADNWMLRTLVNYGEGETSFRKPDLSSALLNEYTSGTTLADAINPYSIADTQNTALLDEILDFYLTGDSKSEMLQARAIVDGSLFELPGGELRIAAGVEYFDEKFEQRKFDGPSGGEKGGYLDADRDVQSVFAELYVPIIGEGNSIPLVSSLAVSLAVRYDDYSDFGSTSNPKFGLDYSPWDWMTIRGTWGESFNAPSLVDLIEGSQSTTSVFPFVPIVPPDIAIPPGSWAMALQGATPDLDPQRAETWSAGFDIFPPVLPGLQLSATYYVIEFEDALGRPPVFDANLFFSNPGYQQFYVIEPTNEQIAAAAATTRNPEEADVLLQPGAPNTFEIIDFRTTNLGNSRIKGLDASVNYTADLDCGTLDLGTAANFRLTSQNQLGPGNPYESDLDFGQPEYFVTTYVGFSTGAIRSRLTWNYRDGYDVLPAENVDQGSVDSFSIVDLFLAYDLQGDGWQEDLTLTLNVHNVFDEDPPENRLDNGDGYANGFTVGQLFQFGIRKTF